MPGLIVRQSAISENCGKLFCNQFSRNLWLSLVRTKIFIGVTARRGEIYRSKYMHLSFCKNGENTDPLDHINVLLKFHDCPQSVKCLL